MFVLKNRDSAVHAVAFSPDGSLLAAAGYWGYVRLWDLASRSLRFERRPSHYKQSAVFFAPGDRLYSFDGNLTAFDVRAGEQVPSKRRGGLLPLVFAAAPWPVPSYCTATAGRRSFSCYALADGRQRWRTALPPGDVFAQATLAYLPLLVIALAFSGDGRTVAAGCATGQTHVLRADDGKAVARVEQPGRPAVKAVALSPDGSRLAVCAGPTLRLYAVGDEPAEVSCVSTGRKHFLNVTWHPSGGLFATTNGDGSVEFWDAQTGARGKAFDWGLGKLNAVAFDATGDRAACGSETGAVVVWDVDR